MQIALAIAATLPVPVGEIKGRVHITRTLTKKRISVPQIYERGAAIPLDTGQASGDEMQRVVVFIEDAGVPSEPSKAVMNQRQRHFEPEVVAVPVGSAVSFPNLDPIFHNVFSLSKLKSFDLGNYSAGESRTVVFARPGLIQLYCHLHPNMSGAILVTPNRWYARPDPDGSFALSKVPAGHYTIVGWHKSAGYFRREVEVRSGQAATIDFEIPILEGQKH